MSESGSGDDTIAPADRPETTLPEVTSASTLNQLAVVERDRYEGRGHVAAGGVGRIALVFDTRLRREVAIKELHDSTDVAAAERFVREALLTARLGHPNIVPIYEAGRWPTGEPFYSMKLVDGRPLSNVITEAQSLADRLALVPHVLGCAQAVAFAHSQGVIHRDLKPANVLVGSFGETVVIDWGLAKEIDDARPDSSSVALAPTDDGESLTLTGSVIGTPAYMSPEQAAGARVDARTDVYAIGAMLYHVLTGRPPYGGSTWIEVVANVLLEPPPALASNLPHELRAIVDKAMARTAAARYADAGELAQDLRAFQDGRIVGAHRYSAWQRTGRFVRRFRTALAAVAMLLVVGSYSLIQSLRAQAQIALQRDSAEHARDEAEHARDQAEDARREASRRADDRTLEQARTAARRVPNLTLALLKSLTIEFTAWPVAQIVAADAVAHGLVTYLRRCEPGEGSSRAQARCPRASVHWLSFAAGGDAIIATHKDGKVARYDPDRGTIVGNEIDVCHAKAAAAVGGTEGILIGCSDGAVKWWQPGTIGARELGRHGDAVSHLVPIAGDRMLSMGFDHTLRVWNPQTGEARLLAQCLRPRESRTAPFAVSGDGTKVVCLALDVAVVVFDIDGRWVAQHTAGDVIEIAVDETAQRVAWGTAAQGATVWDRDTGRATTLPRSAGATYLAFSPDGRRLAIGSHAGDVKVWERGETSAHALPSHAGSVNFVGFVGDTAVMSAGGDGLAQRVELEGGRDLVIAGGSRPTIDAVMEPRTQRLAVRTTDATVWLWQPMAAQTVIAREPRQLQAMAATDDPDRVLVGTAGGELVEVVVPDGAARRVQIGSAAIATIEASPKWIAVGDERGEVVVCDRQLREHWRGKSAGSVVAFSFDAQDSRLAIVHGSTALDVLTIDTRTLDSVDVLDGKPTGVAFVEGGRLAVATHLGELGVVSPELALIRSSRAHLDEIWHLAASADGRIVATVGRDDHVVLYDLDAGTHRALAMPFGAFESRFFDGDRSVMLRSRDYVLRRLDVATAQISDTFVGHGGHIEGFDIAAGSHRFASGSVDDTVRIWDLASGEHRALSGHTDAIEAVLVRPARADVLSISRDGTLRRWADDVPDDGTGLRAWLEATSADAVDEFR